MVFKLPSMVTSIPYVIAGFLKLINSIKNETFEIGLNLRILIKLEYCALKRVLSKDTTKVECKEGDELGNYDM